MGEADGSQSSHSCSGGRASLRVDAEADGIHLADGMMVDRRGGEGHMDRCRHVLACH